MPEPLHYTAEDIAAERAIGTAVRVFCGCRGSQEDLAHFGAWIARLGCLEMTAVGQMVGSALLIQRARGLTADAAEEFGVHCCEIGQGSGMDGARAGRWARIVWIAVAAEPHDNCSKGGRDAHDG